MLRGEAFRMVMGCLAWLVMFACAATTIGLAVLKAIELIWRIR